jgi:outer membrane lipoprotein-sorting protein
MKFLSAFFLAALSVAALPPKVQAPDAAHLATVLAQMDKASANFTSARADVSQEYYESVVHDTTTDTGSVYFQRKGGSTQMGLVTMNPDGKGKHQVIEFKDGMLRIFDVPNNQIRLIKAGANQGAAETFLTLGFGGSGKALAQAWDITDQGTETLMDGSQSVKTEKLLLVSKDANMRNNFTQVTIWVDPVRGVSLRQVFETPSHDKRTANYSHIKLNGSIDTGNFAIKQDKKTTTVGP